MPAPSRTAERIEQLGARRLLILSGKGGVGRTTVAALLGSALAAGGRKVLIATTGHDDRLAWMLGGERLPDVPVELAPRLFVQRLVPATCAEEYGTLVTHSHRLSHAVFGNKLVRRLLRAIPGFDDFAVLGKVWHEAARARSHDVVIFDGPASGHLRLVLGVPDAIVEAVAEGPLTREAALIRATLRDGEACAAVLVGLPESWPLTELGELADALRDELGVHVGARVVNKVWPRALPRLDAPPPELTAMAEAIAKVGRRGDEQAEAITRWLASSEREADRRRDDLLLVPWWPWGADNPERLAELLGATLEERDAAG